MDKEAESYLIFNFIFIGDTITDSTTTTILTSQKPVHRDRTKKARQMLPGSSGGGGGGTPLSHTSASAGHCGDRNHSQTGLPGRRAPQPSRRQRPHRVFPAFHAASLDPLHSHHRHPVLTVHRSRFNSNDCWVSGIRVNFLLRYKSPPSMPWVCIKRVLMEKHT